GPRECQAHIETLALINRAIHLHAIETRAPASAPGIIQALAGGLELRQLHRGDAPNSPYPVGNDLDRLLRRHVAEHRLVLRVEARAQLVEIAGLQWLRSAG